MPYVLYSLAAVWAVLVVAWLLYVVPTPGPLSPLQLGVALVPAAALLVMALVATVLPLILRWLRRALGRRGH